MTERCAICGSRMMCAVECKLHGGPVCENHCKRCFWFEELTWHCSYYADMLKAERKYTRK